MPPASKAREFFSTYTQDLSADELSKLFTRETPEAYRFFARGVNTAELEGLPWHRRAVKYLQAFFLAFTMRLSPARRAIYGVALLTSVIGMFQLFNGFGILSFRLPVLFFVRIGVPAPLFADGTMWLLGGFLLLNLLVLLEVADRLSLKRDLEVAREIQKAMLPEGTWSGPGVEAFGLTQPANTVGGDFYDILPRPDGTVLLALGDVAGKASPAALLMALLLAILRTLVDEDMPLPALARRLNLQVGRHAPASRFITLFLASFDPRTGSLTFVNAGQTPPLLRKPDGTVIRLNTGGVALGMFEGSVYEQGHIEVGTGRCAGDVHRRHHRGREPRRHAVRRSRARADAGAARRCLWHVGRGRAGSGGFRRGRAPSPRPAAVRRFDRPGPEPLAIEGDNSFMRRAWVGLALVLCAVAGIGAAGGATERRGRVDTGIPPGRRNLGIGHGPPAVGRSALRVRGSRRSRSPSSTSPCPTASPARSSRSAIGCRSPARCRAMASG